MCMLILILQDTFIFSFSLFRDFVIANFFADIKIRHA